MPMGKAFKAIFTVDGKQKTVRFGTDSNYVLNKKKTVADRKAYIARHRVNENWSNPTTPGALSRYLLWGPTRDLNTNIRSFRTRFNV